MANVIDRDMIILNLLSALSRLRSCAELNQDDIEPQTAIVLDEVDDLLAALST